MSNILRLTFFIARRSNIESYSEEQPTCTYSCGYCQRLVHARALAIASLMSGGSIYWTLCPCGGPSVLQFDQFNNVEHQSPIAAEHNPNSKWPQELQRLYAEAAHAFSAGAYTASAMVCRKVLMVCACSEGAKEDKSFAYYVDYITENVLTMPRAKSAIDRIRKVGNAATHEVHFVEAADARTSLQVITYLLDALYSLPSPDTA